MWLKRVFTLLYRRKLIWDGTENLHLILVLFFVKKMLFCIGSDRFKECTAVQQAIQLFYVFELIGWRHCRHRRMKDVFLLIFAFITRPIHTTQVRLTSLKFWSKNNCIFEFRVKQLVSFIDTQCNSKQK